MPAASARLTVVSRSCMSTQPAWIASTAAPPAAATSTVSGPMPGVSKRKSWPAATPLTTTAPGPLSAVPRRIASVVPSIASTALTAPRRTTTVWPTLACAITRATAKPRRMSLHSASVGSRDDHVRAAPTQSPRNGRWSRSSMPSPASVPAMTPVMLPSSNAPAWAAMRACAASGGPAPSRSPIQNLPENATAETFSRTRASRTGPIASMRVGTSVSAAAPSSPAPGKVKATTRQPCRRASPAMRAGRTPAPHISPSERTPELMVRLAPRHLGDAVPDHALDLECHGQRAQVVLLGRHHWLAGPAAPHGADQVLDLQLERVVPVHLEVLHEGGAAIADGAAGHRVFLGGALVDVDVLLGVVEHDVGVGLGDGQRADLLLGRPARRDGGDGAGGEADLHGGHVGDLAVHGGALGGQPHGGRVHQVQHDVDVVDHEIHHHGVLLHARDEGPQPPRLDEDGRGDEMLELVDGAVEALHVPHVQDGPAGLGDLEQLPRLLQRGRHRLLHQHADAGLQQVARHVEVLLGGHRHAGHVHLADQVAVVAEGVRLVLRRDGAGAVSVDVGHADQLDARQLRVDEHVVLAHVAGADDTGADGWGHRHQELTSSGAAVSRGAPHMPWRVAPAMKSISASTGAHLSTSASMRSTARLGASPLR